MSLELPSGFLPCKGELVEKAAYPRLFEVIRNTFGQGTPTQFRLPDLQGQFLRCYDGTGQLDPGRRLGGLQSQGTALPTAGFAIAVHGPGSHHHTAETTGEHSHANGEWDQLSIFDGKRTVSALDDVVLPPENREPNLVLVKPMIATGNHSHTISEGSSHSHTAVLSGGDAETRPRNQVAVAFIKY
jgi:hypothetical protein